VHRALCRIQRVPTGLGGGSGLSIGSPGYVGGSGHREVRVGSAAPGHRAGSTWRRLRPRVRASLAIDRGPCWSAEGGQAAFEDGPAVRRAGRAGGLDAGPQVVQVAGGELGAEDRIADADPVGGAREGQNVEVVAAAFPESGIGGMTRIVATGCSPGRAAY
jgi:hypothetical protein